MVKVSVSLRIRQPLLKLMEINAKSEYGWKSKPVCVRTETVGMKGQHKHTNTDVLVSNPRGTIKSNRSALYH